jgi:hypothetical protein
VAPATQGGGPGLKARERRIDRRVAGVAGAGGLRSGRLIMTLGVQSEVEQRISQRADLPAPAASTPSRSPKTSSNPPHRSYLTRPKTGRTPSRRSWLPPFPAATVRRLHAATRAGRRAWCWYERQARMGRRLAAVAARTSRPVRGLRPDCKPLRRTTDRVEATIVSGLALAFPGQGADPCGCREEFA